MKYFLSALFLSILAIFYAVMFRMDISSSYVMHEHKQPVILLSYADGKDVFFKNQQALFASSAGKGFDVIYNYNKRAIDKEFYKQHKNILDEKIGAGYWLWKPYLIYKTMLSSPEGSLIFYLDSGAIINASIEPLLKHMENNDFLTAGAGTKIPLRCHLKKEAYDCFDFSVTEEILNQEYVWGYFILVRNTAEMRDFVKKWLDACVSEKALTNLPFDAKIQDKEFRFHTHDQSLLAVLIAKYPGGKKIISRTELRKKYGIYHHHRHADRENESILWKIAAMPKFLEQIFWNNFLMKWIRGF